MRAVILVLILAIVAIIVLVATGLLDVNQIRGAQAPRITASENGVTAQGGQAPAFEVETGSVEVGSQNATVRVPALEVKRAGEPENQAESANNSM
jgi:hypothetical protein